MSDVTLDWSSAEVNDGTLEVEVQGELPKGWKDSFERTLQLLPSGDWGKVKLKKGRVRVGAVAQGEEDRLRHFLESVVVQANASQQTSEAEPDQDPSAEQDEPDPQDSEMTERFRSFAPDPRD